MRPARTHDLSFFTIFSDQISLHLLAVTSLTCDSLTVTESVEKHDSVAFELTPYRLWPISYCNGLIMEHVSLSSELTLYRSQSLAVIT